MVRDNNKWLNNKINEYSYTGTPMNLLKELQRAVGGSDYHNPDSLFFGTLTTRYTFGRLGILHNMAGNF